MCTVSFVPANNSYFITSNRDEKIIRKQAIPPMQYYVKDQTLVYPKDADGGGSWIAMNEFGNAAVLLNGAFRKHVSLPPYELSRGLVFTDIISSHMPARSFLRLDLIKAEPFTVIILEKDCLYECRWNGSQKHCRQLPESRSYIWSSVTLYDAQMIQKREQWFAEFLNNNLHPSQEEILHFHRFAGKEDTRNSLCMNRDDQMLTVSITAMELTPNKGSMLYNDLKSDELYKLELAFISEPTLS